MAGQTFSSFSTLGDAGIKERVSEKSTLDFGLANAGGLISLVKCSQADRAYVGDDFMPDTNLYNALGVIYPLLESEQRAQALRAYLRQFDEVNSLYVQANHTAYIREPIALSDICVARPAYFPGMEREAGTIKTYKSYGALKKSLMSKGLFKPEKVPNDFCMAYALLRKDMSKFGQSFAKECHPEFLERVLKGIINLRFANARDEKENIEKFKKLLPKSLHDRISKYCEQKDWLHQENYR